MKYRLYLIPLMALLLLLGNCAKKGAPSGGVKDSIPPVIVKSTPENFATNFKGDEIRIYFDEYIKLKDLQKHLIISPPLQYAPLITPFTTSKMIKITLQDTLRENTTYSINFGQSIVDNNEENPYPYYKYVFSTGSYIDSLKLSGNVTDAQLAFPPIPTTVLLYEVNEMYSDSLVFTQKPMYITTTRDSTGTFELTNLKEGTYRLIALNEKTSDYTFQPKNDKIGFINEYVSIPSDTTYRLSLFKEPPRYRITRPAHVSKHEIVFGYEGNADSLEISLHSSIPEDFVSKTYRDIKKDTLHYWFRPATERDSLVFVAKNRQHLDTLTVRLKKLYADTLSISSLSGTTVTPRDTLKLLANTPLTAINPERISIMDRDSVAIPSEARINNTFNTAEIFFRKAESQSYTVRLLPDALTDLYGKTNDTLHYVIRTRALSDYGTLSLTINNVKQYPIIIQLTDSKFNLISEKALYKKELVYFDYIPPGIYYVRLVYDTNENGIWDSGDFLRGRQPEEVVYYPAKLEVRANWSLNETFTLD